MIKLLIPGQPCAKQRPRVVDGHTYTPAKTVNYETFIKELYVIGNYAKQFEGALQMTVRAYFQIPKSKPKKVQELMRQGLIRPTGRPDWDNVGKIISDALNGLAYHDDSYIVSAMVEKWYADNPRAEVEIQEIGA